jgi:exopolyphosphatase/guanosine-5'-triphosphate,3'-diphosphate pyrophosphatase
MGKKQVPAASVAAAIDIGSNSVHLLVARVAPAQTVARRGLAVLDDRSQLLGLGEVVDHLGRIPPDARRKILATLADYLDLAREIHATQITLVATEPFRRAANGADVAAEVSAVTGLTLHVVSGRVEAELTFMGATAGREPDEPVVVVDIGGGSTEVGVFTPGKPFVVSPLRVGSARLTNAIVEHDPPTSAELDELHNAVLAIKRDLPPVPWTARRRPRAIFVGGTATNLARLGRLTTDGLAEDRRTLHRLTGAEISEHFGVRPQRARQLAAGAAIVEVLLEHFGLDEAQVSNASLRDGVIIAAARFGDAWPARLAETFPAAGQPAAEPASASQ